MIKIKLYPLLLILAVIASCNDSSIKSTQTKWNLKETDSLAYLDTIHVCTELLPDLQFVNDVTKIDTNVFVNETGQIDTIVQFNGLQTEKADAAIVNMMVWDIKTLKVKFLDGAPEVIQRVILSAREWEKHCGIRFNFGDHADPDISISFQQRGSWSYIGSYSKKMSPSMNLGWLTATTSNEEVDRVVLHEFGHALGMIHEHLSPTAAIPWNKPVVYKYYMGPPNKWDKPTVDRNMFAKYSATQVNATAFDSLSIMLYAIPRAFTTNGFSSRSNTRLSAKDIAFVGQVYPQ